MTTILGTPLYVDFARTAKRLMENSLHSSRLAEAQPEYWQRDIYRRRAAAQRRNAWDFLASAKAVKEGRAA